MGKKTARREARTAAARARDAALLLKPQMPPDYQAELEKELRSRVDGSRAQEPLFCWDTMLPITCEVCGKHCTGADLYDYPLTPEQEEAPPICKGCRPVKIAA